MASSVFDGTHEFYGIKVPPRGTLHGDEAAGEGGDQKSRRLSKLLITPGRDGS
jgi:hypothetical protein